MTCRERHEYTNSMELPLVRPPIASYQIDATVLSIVLQSDTAWKWFYNNFVQIFVFDQYGTQKLMFRGLNQLPCALSECPFIRTQRFVRDHVIHAWDRLSDFVYDSIVAKHYVFLDLDRFFLPQSSDFDHRHRIHRTLISGVNLQSEQALLSDFYGSHGYKRHWTEFSDLDRSFPYDEIYIDKDRYDLWDKSLVVLLRFIDIDYEFDVQLLVTLIDDYLRSRNTVDSYEEQCTLKKKNARYGLDVYDFLLEYVDRIADGESGDTRLFHTLYDHKNALRLRVRFLIESFALDPHMYHTCEHIAHEALVIRNMVVASQFAQQSARVRRIPLRLETLREAEVRLLEDICAALR